MRIRSTLSGGFAEVDEALGERLITGGSWQLPVDDPAPKRTRRTKAQIAADEAAKTEE